MSSDNHDKSNSRKLAAIVFVDIAGYTALMQRDESLALSKLAKFESTIRTKSDEYNGEVVQFYGDGCLLVFNNVKDSIASLMKMQRIFTEGDIQVPVRIGIHAGEVVYRDGNVFSDSVNVASRIESMGVPGAILLSKAVQRQIKNNPSYTLESLGFFDFKNVDEPMEVYALANEGIKVPKKEELKGKFKETPDAGKKRNRILKFLIPAAVLISILIWKFGFNVQPAGFNSGKVSYNSLAIFPFENLSGKSDLDYLSVGLAENLISSISKQSDLKVISRHSSFALRDSIHNLSFIQRMLNVDAVLMGSVNKINEELVLDTELISARNKERIWGEKLRGNENELPEIENKMTYSLLSSIVDKDKSNTNKSDKKVDAAAYQHFMQGRFLSMGHTKEEIDRAVEHFHKAIEIDAEFAPAYAALANQKFGQARFSNTTRRELIREAKLAISTALKIDPGLPEAHLAEANIKFYCDFDWDGADRSFNEALKMDPNNALIHSDYAFFQCAMNNYDEALIHAEKAINLDPVSISSMHIIGWTNLYKNPKRSVEDFSKSVELHPNWIWGYAKKGMAQVLIDDCNGAMKSFQEVEDRIGDWGGELLESYLSILFKKCGHEEKSREKMQHVLKHVENYGMSDALNLALLHGGTGDLDKMIEFARQCVDEKSVNIAVMQLPKDLDFYFNDPFGDPRYVKLLREVGLPNN
jgi:class 3 adenylate cyclase/TolB-like protein/Tfp pilus assembly protein PilF